VATEGYTALTRLHAFRPYLSERNARLYKALATLTKQEREVVSRFFDLVENPDIDRPNAEDGELLTEIAKTMGISKQRASAVKRRALIKLRKVLGKPCSLS